MFYKKHGIMFFQHKLFYIVAKHQVPFIRQQPPNTGFLDDVCSTFSSSNPKGLRAIECNP